MNPKKREGSRRYQIAWSVVCGFAIRAALYHYSTLPKPSGKAVLKHMDCESDFSYLSNLTRQVFPPPAAPANLVDPETSEPILSWRVRVAPPELFNKFDLTRRWNTAPNDALVSQMPEQLDCGNVGGQEGLTSYTLLLRNGNLGFEWRRKLILFARSAERIPWTAPVDLDFATKAEAIAYIREKYPDGLHVCFSDGTTQIIRADEIRVREQD